MKVLRKSAEFRWVRMGDAITAKKALERNVDGTKERGRLGIRWLCERRCKNVYSRILEIHLPWGQCGVN